MTKRICAYPFSLHFPDLAQANRLPNVETYVLGAAESDSGDARDPDQVALLQQGLAGLLLVARVDYSSRTGGERSIAELFSIGLIAGILFLDRGLGLGLVVGKLFNSRVGHFGDCGGG